MELKSTVLFRKGKPFISNSYAFDLDSTLIETGDKRKKSAASTPNWIWWNVVVPEVLHKLEESGSTIIIFSNQSDIDDTRRKILENKIAQICDNAKINPWVFIATKHNWYRKPLTGLLEFAMFEMACKEKPVVFVGDAAGRPDDFADSDIKFAYNVDIPFATPEQYFLGSTTKITLTLTDYSEILVSKKVADDERISIMNCIAAIDKPVAVFMCGPPASGKSTLATLISKKYKFTYINQDELGTKAKMFKTIQTAVGKNESIIIDKLFPTVEERDEYLSLLPESYTNICIIVNIKRNFAEALNLVRAELTHGDVVPSIVYATFYKKYVEPSITEFDYVFIYNSLVSRASDAGKLLGGT